MVTQRHLKKVPITEALIDFRVELAPDFNLAQFEPLQEELLNEYPTKKRLMMKEFKLNIGIEGKQPIEEIPSEGMLVGYRFETEDGKNVAQFRDSGFTFSRLKPYTTWESIFTEAKRLWNIYVAKASPKSVTRIAVRYINHMSIPLPIHDFSRYLTAPPNVPTNIPQEISNFLSRVTIRDSQLGINANITQALEISIEPSEYAIIILDIDVYKVHSFLIDESKMWDTFAELHSMKNRIFFDMITEDTVRLFE